MPPKQSDEPTSLCQPPAPCLLQSAPCPTPPHTFLHSASMTEQALPSPRCKPPCVFSALLCSWLKHPDGRLGTKIWGAANLPPQENRPPCEAGQGGGLWLRRHLRPQSYACDLTHHVSCCSLPARRAGAAGRAGSMQLLTPLDKLGARCSSTLQHGPWQKPQPSPTIPDVSSGTTTGGGGGLLGALQPACRQGHRQNRCRSSAKLKVQSLSSISTR